MKNLLPKTIYLFIFLFLSISLLGQQDVVKSIEQGQIIDNYKTKHFKVLSAYLINPNDTINLFETIDDETFVITFNKIENLDSTMIWIGNVPKKTFLVGKMIYDSTIKKDNLRADIYKGEAFSVFNKKAYLAEFTIELIPETIEKYGQQLYNYSVFSEDGSSLFLTIYMIKED